MLRYTSTVHASGVPLYLTVGDSLTQSLVSFPDTSPPFRQWQKRVGEQGYTVAGPDVKSGATVAPVEQQRLHTSPMPLLSPPQCYN